PAGGVNDRPCGMGTVLFPSTQWGASLAPPGWRNTARAERGNEALRSRLALRAPPHGAIGGLVAPADQTRTTRSRPPLASRRPSGLVARACTWPMGPSQV